MPAVVSEETFARVAQRLADNKRFASRNSRNPSLLQGIAACAACGYGYYRTTTRTTNKKIHYYRCLGSDNYRYKAGRVCANKPVRADYLDTVVWDHIAGLLAEPRLIHAEIDKRLEGARAADPVTRQRTQLENALGTAANGIARMIEAFGEQLITIDELRARMPDLRAREANLRNQIQALDAQLADREAYLALAADLQGFLTQLHARTETSTLDERRRVLKLLIKDVLIGPEKITIRHRIPLRERVSSDTQHTGNTDTEGEHPEHCPMRWGRKDAALRGARLGVPDDPVLGQNPRLQERLDQRHDTLVGDASTHPVQQHRVRDLVKAGRDVTVQHPLIGVGCQHVNLGDRVVGPTSRTEAVAHRLEIRLEDRLEEQLERGLHRAVRRGGDPELAQLAARFRDRPLAHRQRCERAGLQLRPQPGQELLLPRAQVTGTNPVDPGRTRSSVTPHPVPGHP